MLEESTYKARAAPNFIDINIHKGGGKMAHEVKTVGKTTM